MHRRGGETRMRIHAPQDREQREPAEPFHEVPLRVVRELVRENDLLLALVERLEEHRVPEDDPAAARGRRRTRVRLLGGVGADLLDADRDVAHAELGPVLVGRGEKYRVLVASSYSRGCATNVKSAAIETKTAAPGYHQSPSRRASPHHDEQGDADGEELCSSTAQSSNSQST